MSLRLFSLLLCALSFCDAAQNGVDVRLRSCRTEYRTHNSAMAPGFSCTVELIPPDGMRMCESTMLSGVIRVKDRRSVRLAELGPITITPDNRAFTTISCPSRPHGTSVELQGEAQVTVAKERIASSHAAVSMLNPSEHDMKVAQLIITPSANNAQKRNREGTHLKRAELALTCTEGMTIRRVERVWKGIDGEQYSQPIDLESTGGNTYKLQLWDATPIEFLSFVFVKDPRREKVKFRMNVQLGEKPTETDAP